MLSKRVLVPTIRSAAGNGETLRLFVLRHSNGIDFLNIFGSFAKDS